jgi:phytanoyl-CoA hydroxylase
VLDRFFSEDEITDLEQVLDGYAVADRPREVLFSQKIAERDAKIRAFARSDVFVQLSTALLGPDTDLYFSQMVYKNPEGNTTFSWHQDDAYGPVEPSPYLTVWIAISDATEENGCLSVLPGSHKNGLVTHKEGGFGLACYELSAPDQGALLPVSRGSMICFWSTTMHKSGPNLSKATRKALIFQFTPLGICQKASGMTIRPKIPIARDGLLAQIAR